MGAAQLLLMERLPDHAVINESVELAKRRIPRAAGLTNAVLRRVAALRAGKVDRPQFSQTPGTIPDREELPLCDGRALRLTEPVFAEDPLARLAAQTSHPIDVLDRWSSRLGRAKAVELALHNLIHAPVIVAGLPPGLPWCTPHDESGFCVFAGDREALEGVLADHPTGLVQDPSVARAVEATAGLMPGLIIEVCAGKGTKTRQLAELHRQARIIATDAKPARRALLAKAFSGNDRVRVVEPDELLPLAGQADLVVVDVPCSNSAVLARRVEARYRIDEPTLGSLVDLQRQIVADAMRHLSDAGHFLYSTCSLEPEENRGQVDWVMRWHRMRLRRTASLVPRGLPGDPPARYADGGFFALLQRSPGNLSTA